MADSDPGRESLAALSRFFVGDSSFEETLQRVIELAVVAVPPADYTGISMLVEGAVKTSIFTDPTIPEIDQAQYDTGDGPCLDAFRNGEIYEIPSTRTDDRWPAFCRQALDHGIQSTVSLPMTVGHENVGALNFYSKSEGGFSASDREAGEVFAMHAAVVLANAQAYWDARSLSENLTEAMRSRATIEQAKGILMGQSKISSDAAFQMLVSVSQRENRKLREIAEELVLRYSGES